MPRNSPNTHLEHASWGFKQSYSADRKLTRSHYFADLLLRQKLSVPMTADTGNTGQSGGSGSHGGGQSSSHISSAIPALLVVFVVAIMALTGWYIVRRIRLTGRSILSLLAGSAHQPELTYIELTEPPLQHTDWDAILPIAVEFISPVGREQWEQERQRSPRGSSSSVAMHSDSEGRLARYTRGHTASEERRQVDLFDSDNGGLRIAVLVAMPSPPRGPRRADSENNSSVDSDPGIAPELCLGTIHTSVRS
ncbi:hypothetical protein C8T65DRAFT_737043 [Cerioporus squamosus]|nr:hypothetical protein C8T65DRAFT_737043 [Cerioporus squamosus]